MGEEGCGSMNEWRGLLECGTAYEVVIDRTLFANPDIHKLTGRSPNGIEKHRMISGAWRKT